MGRPLFSAGDLVAHLECEHATTVARQDLEALLARADDKDTLEFFEVDPQGLPAVAAAHTLAAWLIAELVFEGVLDYLVDETGRTYSRALRSTARSDLR